MRLGAWALLLSLLLDISDVRAAALRRGSNISPNGLCGPSNGGYICTGSAFGSCCSQYGYCGTSDDFCASGCEPDFGECGEAYQPEEPSSGSVGAFSTVDIPPAAFSTAFASEATETAVPTSPGSTECGCESDSSLPTATATATAVATAAPNPSNDGEELQGCVPGDGAGPDTTLCAFQQDLQCYALPYGAFGFASDATTLYTIMILRAGKSPLLPWRKLQGSNWDICMGAMTILGAGISAIVNAARCADRWELVALSMWKMILSICMGAMTIHTAHIARDGDDRAFGKMTRSLAFYSTGLICGIAGLCGLAFGDDVDLPSSLLAPSVGLAVGMLAFPLVPMGFSLLLILFCGDKGFHAVLRGLRRGLLSDPSVPQKSSLYIPVSIVLWFVFFWGLGAIFFGGWVLAVLAQNIIGVPSTANLGVFVAYMIFKRFPMLSGLG